VLIRADVSKWTVFAPASAASSRPTGMFEMTFQWPGTWTCHV
jgi:hypothetical protein